MRRLVLVVGTAVVLVATFSLARWGIADLYAYPARWALEDWAAGEPVDDIRWQNVVEYLSFSMEWSPLNADYADLMGQLYDWKWHGRDASRFDRFVSDSVALAFYREVTRLRKRWPRGWARVALNKSRLGEFDDEYRSALRIAIERGPWEAGVQRAVVIAGLAGWDALDRDGHELVLVTASRGMRHRFRGQPRGMAEILRTFDRLAEVCARTEVAELDVAECNPESHARLKQRRRR